MCTSRRLFLPHRQVISQSRQSHPTQRQHQHRPSADDQVYGKTVAEYQRLRPSDACFIRHPAGKPSRPASVLTEVDLAPSSEEYLSRSRRLAAQVILPASSSSTRVRSLMTHTGDSELESALRCRDWWKVHSLHTLTLMFGRCSIVLSA
jgi:hypothetical protein